MSYCSWLQTTPKLYVLVTFSSGNETRRGPSRGEKLWSGGVGSDGIVGALVVVGLEDIMNKTHTLRCVAVTLRCVAVTLRRMTQKKEKNPHYLDGVPWSSSMQRRISSSHVFISYLLLARNIYSFLFTAFITKTWSPSGISRIVAGLASWIRKQKIPFFGFAAYWK